MENILLIVSEIIMTVFLTLFAVIVNFIKLSFVRNENAGAADGEVPIKIPEAGDAADFSVKEPEDVMIMKEPVSSDAAGDYDLRFLKKGLQRMQLLKGLQKMQLLKKGLQKMQLLKRG